MTDLKKYDLICSIGSNCSVSMQLEKRKLRFVALPFDWLWYNSEKSINSITNGFKNNFADFLKIENLRKLEGDEYSKSHTDRYQYEDTATGIFYYNHFYKVPNEKKEIDRVIKLQRKRFKRFEKLLRNAKNVLFILSLQNEISEECVINLHKIIKETYPECRIDFYCQMFSCPNNEIKEYENIKILKYQRAENLYDYSNTNFEWKFLDDLTISDRLKDTYCGKIYHKLIIIKKIKKGMLINFFPKINTLLYFKLYIFGLRLHFSLGKNRQE